MHFSKLFAWAAVGIAPALAAPAASDTPAITPTATPTGPTPSASTPATTPSAKPADGKYCTKWEGKYSEKEYTYGGFRFCIRVKDSKAEFIGQARSAAYYFYAGEGGDSWHSASEKHPYEWYFSAEDRTDLFRDDGGAIPSGDGDQQESAHQDQVSGRGKGTSSKTKTFDVGQISDPIAPGTHQYLFSYEQQGPTYDSKLSYSKLHTIEIPVAGETE